MGHGRSVGPALADIALAAVVIAALGGCGNATGQGLPGFTHPVRNYIVPMVFPGAAYGVAVSPQGVVLVTNIRGNQVYRGQSLLDGFFDSVSVNLAPAHVAITPAGTRAFSTDQLSHTLSVIDLATNTRTTSIPLGNEAYNLLVSPDGTRLYVTVNAGSVYVFNVATLAIVDSFTAGPVANGLAFSPDGLLLYASSRDAGQVVIYDTEVGSVVDTLVTGGMPQRMAVSGDGKEIYIANERLGLDIWNLATRTRITSVSMGAYGLALTPDNAHIYVSHPPGGMVRVVDRATRAVIDSIPTGGEPRNIAFNREGTEALITNEAGYVTVIH